MAKLKIKKGDTVQVITGAKQSRGGDRGKQGKVLAVYPEANRVLVEGVRVMTKHVKPGQNANGATSGGIQHVEAPIHVSNVMLVDPSTKKPTRVGIRVETEERNGRTHTKRVRVAKRSGKDI